jgi:hypothetical protein
MDKQEQKQILIDMMEQDEKLGLYSVISKMERTQTAVEWLAIELYEKMNMSGDGKLFDSLIRVAKQMEKEWIAQAYESGWVNGDLKKAPRFGEDYYNETYNK